MIERQWWWPVATQDELKRSGGQPLALRVLGERLVLWQGASGQASLLDDQCPHRGAKLSMGRVCGDALQCPYHGWRFGAGGQCLAIPAQPGFVPPASSAARNHELKAAHGLWWARLAQGAELPQDSELGDATGPRAGGESQPRGTSLGPPPLPILPERHLIYGPFDVATSAPRAVENFLDTAHFAYVHEGWLGDQAHPEVPPYEVQHTPDGRPLIAHYRAWQPRASASSQLGAWVEYRYEVLSPYAALLSKQGQGGGAQDSYVIWACPQTETSCRLWFAQYTTDAQTPAEELRDFQLAIFAQDQPILESQEPKALPVSGGEAMSAADRLSAAYRRYLKSCGIAYGVC